MLYLYTVLFAVAVVVVMVEYGDGLSTGEGLGACGGGALPSLLASLPPRQEGPRGTRHVVSSSSGPAVPARLKYRTNHQN